MSWSKFSLYEWISYAILVQGGRLWLLLKGQCRSPALANRKTLESPEEPESGSLMALVENEKQWKMPGREWKTMKNIDFSSIFWMVDHMLCLLVVECCESSLKCPLLFQKPQEVCATDQKNFSSVFWQLPWSLLLIWNFAKQFIFF